MSPKRSRQSSGRRSSAVRPAGADPDTFIRKHGGAAYQEQLRQSRQYLEYLLDKTASEYDLRRDEDRREMPLTVVRLAEAWDEE